MAHPDPARCLGVVVEQRSGLAERGRLGGSGELLDI